MVAEKPYNVRVPRQAEAVGRAEVVGTGRAKRFWSSKVHGLVM